MHNSGWEILEGCRFPELFSTTYGIFWNTENGVINSSWSFIEVDNKKVMKFCYPYSSDGDCMEWFVDVYLAWEKESKLLHFEELIWKDLY